MQNLFERTNGNDTNLMVTGPDFFPLKLMENCVMFWQLHKIKIDTKVLIQLSAVSLFAQIGDSGIKNGGMPSYTFKVL